MFEPRPKSDARGACALCGLPLPGHPVRGGGEDLFCCSGCAHVAAILQTVGRESDVGRVRYDFARRYNLVSSAGAPSGASNSAIPNPQSAISNQELPPERREKARFHIEGLVCPSCAWLAEELLVRHEGVASAEVDFFSDTASLVFDLLKTSRQAIEQELAAAGYRLVALDGGTAIGAARRLSSEQVDLIRLALAAAISCNLMMLAWVGYDTYLTGDGNAQTRGIAWLQLLFALPAVTWAALPLYRRALAALRRGRVVMESLVSLGVIAAVCLSVFALVSGEEHVYFETAAMLVAISLGGRALERWFKRRAARSLTQILQFHPTKARRAEDGRFAPLNQFEQGARVLVEPREIVPLDVRIEVGQAVSLSKTTAQPEESVCPHEDILIRDGLLTGEPHPVTRRAGDVVLAGSLVERGRLTGVVERPAGQTVADAIRVRVTEALRRGDGISRMADRFAQGFVPLVLMVAVAACVAHWLHGDSVRSAMLTGVAVLVVACPCAFGVAASTALSLASLRLAKTGILIKDPAALEILPKIDTVIFDKTGTLTQGDLTLVEIGWTGESDEPLLVAVAALESHSRHPIAVSVNRALSARQYSTDPSSAGNIIEGYLEIPGLGVTGTISGRRIAVGSLSLFTPQLEIRIPQSAVSATRVWFGCAGETPSGFLDLADSLRPGAVEFVRACQSWGLDMALFSGDAREPTEAIAREAGIATAFGGLRPEEKAERVGALRAEGRRVLYIGDGFNDAEALAAADVGVALASGADLAMLSAPVVVTDTNLRAMSRLMDTTSWTIRTVHANFLWAFMYNIAFLPLAAFGWLAPIYAAALMAVSSLSVAVNSTVERRGGFRAAKFIRKHRTGSDEVFTRAALKEKVEWP